MLALLASGAGPIGPRSQQLFRSCRKERLITGVTGQDGAYLAELLLQKGYEVHGIKRRASSFNTDRIDHLYQDPHEQGVRLQLHYGDLTDATNLIRIVQQVQPDEIYNLAAQSHVAVSFETPEYTANADAIGTLRLLEAIRILGLKDKTRFYQASTSEMFGLVQEIPQKETTPFYPRSPYGAAKVYGHWITVNYREAYGMYACSGILFNHESPIRGETFVTRKITRASRAHPSRHGAVPVSRQHGFPARLGSCARLRAGTVADAAAGRAGRLRHRHGRAAFGARVRHPGRRRSSACSIEWRGKGVDEQGVDYARPAGAVVRVDPRYFRPTEVETLLGDPTKARTKLGWKPEFSFEDLVSRDGGERPRDRPPRFGHRARRLQARSGTRSERRAQASSSPAIAGSSGPRSCGGSNANPACGCCFARARSSTSRASPPCARSSSANGPRRCISPRPRSGASSPTTHGRRSSSMRIWSSSRTSSTPRIAAGTRKLLFLGSSCIYPKHAPQPMPEDCLLTGPLEPTNEWYAIAKIAGLKTCQAYRKQYGFDAICAMPTNLYGPGDNFDLASSHVLPALIRKFDSAVETAVRTRWRSGARAPRAGSSCTWTIWPTPASI